MAFVAGYLYRADVTALNGGPPVSGFSGSPATLSREAWRSPGLTDTDSQAIGEDSRSLHLILRR